MQPQKRLHLGNILFVDRRTILEMSNCGGMSDKLKAVGIQVKVFLLATDILDADGAGFEGEIAPGDLGRVLIKAGQR
jgi:hypothetical protein